MARPYPQEFRDDVVRVARNRESGVTLEQIAADFGVHPVTLSNWMRQADVDDGAKPGTTTNESSNRLSNPGGALGDVGLGRVGGIGRQLVQTRQDPNLLTSLHSRRSPRSGLVASWDRSTPSAWPIIRQLSR